MVQFERTSSNSVANRLLLPSLLILIFVSNRHGFICLFVSQFFFCDQKIFDSHMRIYYLKSSKDESLKEREIITPHSVESEAIYCQ